MTKSKDYNEGKRDKMERSKSVMMTNKKKNQKRLGGKGLSLEVFANAKSKDNNYNPAIIKKKREFYKNAKYVKKYKQTLKQQSEPQHRPFVNRTISEEGDVTNLSKGIENKNKRNTKLSLEGLYANKRQEQEKARLEKEALFQAKKEARERTEGQRKEIRERMYKKTKSGQPVMKYRMEHLLQSIEGSQS
ncbi:E3 ubiquitin-protein ligase miel1 [Thalictrum thalictroides]|uniref:E3 ubiquitin-protein ligase miel1 n=1 Tax=Thalictrum thalictroides TaxID=46969 RepID=A0A7J6XD06_THATH|nr:E3 ubiquitin-protein ligase miel1 [Thalictrum thalictroides]